MADFTLWATACETALWPTGTFARAYEANRRAAVESMIDADPVAGCVREIMAQRKTWIGTAADLLCFGGEYSNGAISSSSTVVKKSARLAAGCGERSLGCVLWALKSSLAAKAEQAPGQLPARALSPDQRTLRTVQTLGSRTRVIVIVLVPARPSRLKTISMPSERNPGCARRSRPASARGLFDKPVLLLEMPPLEYSPPKQRRSAAVPIQVFRWAMISRTQLATGSASTMLSTAVRRFAS